MSDDPGVRAEIQPTSWAHRLGAIGVDWWATIVAGVIVALAVLDLLPKIPW
jgi:hypothetical protein